MSIHRSPLVAQAHELAESEGRRLEAEIDAFERFVDSVRELPVDQRVADGGTTLLPGPQTVTCTGDATRFRAVRDAYQQTVLAVDHWQDAYDESTVVESMAAEFTTDLARLVAQPGTARFNPALHTHLIEEGKRAVAMRKRTRTFLEAEVAELERLMVELEPVAELIDAIRAGRATFDVRVDQVRQARRILEQLLKTHQVYIHGRPRRRYDPFVASVYADLDVNHPGLASIANYIARVQRIELRLWAGLYDDECTTVDNVSP